MYYGTNEGELYHYDDGVILTDFELKKDGVNTSIIDSNLGGTHHPGVWAPYVDDALKWLGFY
jgi:hypothetical protein